MEKWRSSFELKQKTIFKKTEKYRKKLRVFAGEMYVTIWNRTEQKFNNHKLAA